MENKPNQDNSSKKGRIKNSTAILFIVLALIVGGFASHHFLPATGQDTQVVESMKKESNIEFLALNVTDIYDKTESTKLLGTNVNLPFSDKTEYLKGTFSVHLGIDGSKVKFYHSVTNSHDYTITIPNFKALSISNQKFVPVDIKGGALSFGTQIDTNKMQDNATSDSALKKYVTPNIPFLKDQAKSYYTQLAKAIDPKANLTFKYIN